MTSDATTAHIRAYWNCNLGLRSLISRRCKLGKIYIYVDLEFDKSPRELQVACTGSSVVFAVVAKVVQCFPTVASIPLIQRPSHPNPLSPMVGYPVR